MRYVQCYSCYRRYHEECLPRGCHNVCVLCFRPSAEDDTHRFSVNAGETVAYCDGCFTGGRITCSRCKYTVTSFLDYTRCQVCRRELHINCAQNEAPTSTGVRCACSPNDDVHSFSSSIDNSE